MDSLVGVWGCERQLGPELRGELTVVRSGAQWCAQIEGFSVDANKQDDGMVRFTIPGNRGEFRGRLSDDETNLNGHWLQPGGIGNYNSYATPTTLQAQQTMNNDVTIWRGMVEPLEDWMRLYLVIQKVSGGENEGFSAFIRDPERNIGARLPFKSVTLEGSKLRLVGRAQGEIVGDYDEENDLISFRLRFYPGTLDFTRRGAGDAVGFYPRTPAARQYVYRQPLAENDGWKTDTLENAGLKQEPIIALVEQILGTATTGVTTPYIHSLLIARGGKLVLEEYFYGFHKERTHDMRSATKTLSAPLVGIAMDREARIKLTTPVYSLFPQYASYENPDPRKEGITVEHLLTMTSGYDCDDDDDSTPGNEDVMQDQDAQPDWYKYTLDLPMVREAGVEGAYCSAGMNLLGGAIANATSTWLPDFFYEHYAAPLDFGRYHLQIMPPPLSTMYLGGGSYLRPRDFMKLGQLFLSKGKWNGRQIVSEAWAEQALQPRSTVQGHQYGYGWHLGEYQVDGRTYRRAEAGGNGGQLVIIVPDLDLVVMLTAGNYGDYRTWSKFRDELVPGFIIPAMLQQT